MITWSGRDAYVVRLLRFLHDKLPDHGGAEFHQVREDVCSCCPHLQVIHSLNKSGTVKDHNKEGIVRSKMFPQFEDSQANN